MIHFGYRYYNPRDGRWLSRDPNGENGGINLYAFCGNDPINRYDYLGLFYGPAAVAMAPCKKFLDFDLTSPDEHSGILDKVFLQPWGMKYVNNSQQILDAIKKAVPKYDPYGKCSCGSCIQGLTLSAHGEGAAIPLSRTDPKSPDKESFIAANSDLEKATGALAPARQRLRDQFMQAKNVLQSIKSKMCAGGKITFVICEAGAGAAGQDLLHELQNIFGQDITVVLFEGNAGYFLGAPVPAR